MDTTTKEFFDQVFKALLVGVDKIAGEKLTGGLSVPSATRVVAIGTIRDKAAEES